LDRKWTNIIIWPRDRANISVQQLRIKYVCYDLGRHQIFVSKIATLEKKFGGGKILTRIAIAFIF
jgi:hypothetical protein